MALDSLGPLTVGVDPVGFVWDKLRGYLGPLAVAKELLQNADDAFRDDRGPIRVEFDFRPESLVVHHNGKPFDGKDFESITLIASGDKRIDIDRTGTFGVGFVSVYHLTDRPTVESNGWRISWNVADREVIPQQVTPAASTRFEFPWRAEPSDFSRRIGAEPSSEARRAKFLHDLGRHLPGLLLFLRYVTEIVVSRDGELLYRVTKTRQRPRGLRGRFEVEIDWKAPKARSTERWLCAGAGVRNTELATLLKPRVGEESDVCLGFRLTPPPGPDFDGLIYNLLPTAVSTGYPFHIEGQFFPNSERTSIICGEGDLLGWTDEAKWNANLVNAAGDLLVETIDGLREALKGREEELYAYLPVREPAFAFVSALRAGCLEAARTREWIWASTSEWRTATESYRIAPNLRKVLEREAVPFVESRVQQRYERFLGAIGVPDFGPRELYDLLRRRAPDSLALSQSASCLNQLWKLRQLYGFLSDRADEVEPGWPDLPVWVTETETLEKAKRLWLPDAEFRTLFEARRATFVHHEVEIPAGLAEKLGIRRLDRRHLASVVEFLESLALSPIAMHDAGPPLNDFQTLQRLHGCLGRALSETSSKDQAGLVSRLRRLTIFPNQGGALRAIDEPESLLKLPPKEPLSDVPLELDNVVHVEALRSNRPFFEDALQVQALTLDNYVTDYLVREYGRDYLSAEDKFRVLEWVRRIHPQLHEAAWSALKKAPLVECSDGRFRGGGEVYFRNDALDEILGDYPVPSRRYRGEPWKDLLSKLGVTDVPREHDLVRRAEGIASSGVNDAAVRQIRALFQYVDATFFRKAGAKPPVVLQRLAEIAWLPAKADNQKWYRGRELYPGDAEPLVGPQKRFLRLQRPTAEFARVLGLQEPTVEDIVECLIWSSEAGHRPNTQIYQRLNAALVKDGALVRLQLAPLGGRAVIYHHGRYWHAEQAFFTDYRQEFGKHRVYLGRTDALEFFRAIGVKDDLLPVRYTRFLLDLADWKRGEVLNEADCKLVENAYLRLAEADEPDTALLGGKEVVLDSSRRLVAPGLVFLLDRPALVKKFGEDTIPCPLTKHALALRVLERIGVERISAVVSAVPVELDEGPDNPTQTSRIRLLAPAFRRIRDTLAKKFEDGWRAADGWGDLRVRSANRIRLRYRYLRDGNCVDSEVHDEQAYLDEATAILYVADAGRVSVANSLAQWLNPEIDSAVLSPILALLLECPPGEEKELLDAHGFDDLGIDLPLPRRIYQEPEEGADDEEEDEDGALPRSGEMVRAEARPGRPLGGAPGRRPIGPAGPGRDGSAGGEVRGPEPGLFPAREFRFSISYPASDRSGERGGEKGGDLVEKGVEGVRCAMQYEEQEGRRPHDVSAENRGYDIESAGPAERRLIEVKLRSSPGTGVLDLSLTPNEVATALKYRDDYYVYVIEKLEGAAGDVVVHEVRLGTPVIRWGAVPGKSRWLSLGQSSTDHARVGQTSQLLRAAVHQLASGISDVTVLSEAVRMFMASAAELDLDQMRPLVLSLQDELRRAPVLKRAVSEALEEEVRAAWQGREAERVEHLLEVLGVWDQEASRNCAVRREEVSDYRAFVACSDAWERYRSGTGLLFLTREERDAARQGVWDFERPRLNELLTRGEIQEATELFWRVAAVITEAGDLQSCGLRLAGLLERAGEEALQAGQSAQATAHFESAIGIYRWLPEKTDRGRRREAMMFEGLAEAYARSGRARDAVLAYELLRITAQDHDEVRDIVGPLARLYSLVSLPDRAADVLDEFEGEYDDLRAECVEDRLVDVKAHQEWKRFLQQAQAGERYNRMGLSPVIAALMSVEEFWESGQGGRG